MRYVMMSLLLIAGTASSQEIPLKVDGSGVKVVQVDKVIIVKEDRTVVSSFPVVVQAPALQGAGLYFWSYPIGVTATDLNDRLEITSAPRGELVVSVKVVAPRLDKDGKFVGFDTRLGKVMVYVGDIPLPPKPEPPKPPDVKPDPPTPVSGVRVILINESSAAMSRGHLAVWNSTALKDYLDSRCVKGTDGRPEWRKYDKDVIQTKEPKTLVDLWAATKPKLTGMKLPALLIVSDASGELYPLPETVEAAVALIKQKVGG
jgi:hypothetical protein